MIEPNGGYEIIVQRLRDNVALYKMNLEKILAHCEGRGEFFVMTDRENIARIAEIARSAI